MVVDFYQQLYTNKEVMFNRTVIPNFFPATDVVDLAGLNKYVEDCEIKKALFHIVSWKTPGFGGFLASFFQKFWEMGYNICSFVKEVFSIRLLPTRLNDTLISIIFNVDCP